MNNVYNILKQAKFNIDIAACLKIGTEWNSMVNTFKYVRIYYIRQGSAKLTLTNGILELEEGYLYYIPAFTVMGGSCNDNMEHYFIHIIPDIVTELFFKISPSNYKIKLNRSDADYLFSIVASNFNSDSAYSKFVTDNALKLILSYFLKNSEQKALQTNMERFVNIFDYIDKNIDSKIRIKDLASLNCMDDVYFTNLFSATFRCSPQKYIQEKRTDRAQMLLSTNMSISNIANKMGFFDASAFSTFFKRQTGMTPSAFRDKLM